MRRPATHTASEYLPRGAAWPLARMIMFMVVLIMIISWTRDPQNWQWLAMLTPAEEQKQDETTAQPKVVAPTEESVVSGPNDLDPKEMEEIRKLFEAVEDKKDLVAIDMPAYWRLMRWGRSQKFADLEKRAAPKVRYAQLFEQPGEFRGKPVRLRVHIRKLVSYDAPENSAGVKRVYEAWGWTDDSKSFPFVLVFDQLPAGMKEGEEVVEEGVFVGYFLKLMAYTAFDARRAAPLLVGKMSRIDAPMVSSTPPIDPKLLWLSAAAAVGLLAFFIIAGIKMSSRRRKILAAARGTGDDEAQDWLKQQSAQ